MGYSREAYEYARTQVAERKAAAERDAEARRAALETSLPEWKALEDRLSAVGLAGVKAAVGLAGTRELQVFRAEYEDLLRQRTALMAQKGLSEDDLLPRYVCPLCGDTG
ncbi:MAG: hypothetical protein J6X61_04405, partial [Clostridia bacterium]|nr:hypothetical protein [Clostridia bacterium]